MKTHNEPPLWTMNDLSEIERPKNSQRSKAAWQRIGYKPAIYEKPVGYSVDYYKHPFPLWDDKQVEPIKGKPAHRRRADYHAYLFRLRVYRNHAPHINKLHNENPDDALIYVVELMENISLWMLGVLVQLPEKLYDFDVLVVTDALKSVPPLSPYKLAENDANSSDEGVI